MIITITIKMNNTVKILNKKKNPSKLEAIGRPELMTLSYVSQGCGSHTSGFRASGLRISRVLGREFGA